VKATGRIDDAETPRVAVLDFLRTLSLRIRCSMRTYLFFGFLLLYSSRSMRLTLLGRMRRKLLGNRKNKCSRENASPDFERLG